nr:MAG TPA: hypothetical protein [Caudoviricetes sp.]
MRVNFVSGTRIRLSQRLNIRQESDYIAHLLS